MLQSWLCLAPKHFYFSALIFAYVIGLVAVGTRDNRFLKNYAEFCFNQFSIKKFGMAAVLNIISVPAFVFIALFVPRHCI